MLRGARGSAFRNRGCAVTPERLTAALSDRYRIERELGAGGMATVYLAHDLKHERDVAIKARTRVRPVPRQKNKGARSTDQAPFSGAGGSRTRVRAMS